MPGLGGGVVGLARVAGVAHHRGDVHDPPAPRLHHAAQHRARQHEDALQVGRLDLVPLLVLHAREQVVAGDAGVVHEDRHGPEVGRHACRRRPRRRRRRARRARGRRPGRRPRRCALETCSAPLSEVEVPTTTAPGPGEREGDRLADAARGPGDDGDLSVQHGLPQADGGGERRRVGDGDGFHAVHRALRRARRAPCRARIRRCASTPCALRGSASSRPSAPGR